MHLFGLLVFGVVPSQTVIASGDLVQDSIAPYSLCVPLIHVGTSEN